MDKDFAENFQSTLDVDTLVTKINAEISHLGYGRKTRADEKLGSIDMNWLKPAIDSEIRRFEESLNFDCRDHWVKRRPVPFIAVNATHTTSTSELIIVKKHHTFVCAECIP